MSIEWLMLSSSTSPVVVRESALMILSIGHCQLLMADCWKIDVFELWCWRRLLRVPWTAGRSTSPCKRRSVLSVYWKDWCWSWNSNTLATWSKELTHLKRPWCWERLRAGGEGDDRGWDGWMASSTQWHEFGWTPGVGDGQGGLACCGSCGRKESDMTERLNWTEFCVTRVQKL